MLLVIEVLNAVISCRGQWKPREEKSFSQGELSLFRSGFEEEVNYYVDQSYSGKNRRICTPEMILDRGIYLVTVDYETDNTVGSGRIGCYSHAAGEDTPAVFLRSGMPQLIDGLYTMEYRVYVYDSDVRIRIENVLEDNWEASLLIRGVRVGYLRGISALHEFLRLTALFLLIDLLLAVVLWRRRETAAWLRGNAETIAVLSLTILIASLPMVRDYIGKGHDLRFHLHRIYELALGIRDGCFPVYIMPEWMNGYGYAAGVFYGDLLLYLPAFLYLAGFPLATGYCLLVFAMNILTAFIAFFCFRRMSDDRSGLLASAMYTLGVYRLLDVYTRAAVGEWTAMAFLPFLVLGIYQLYCFEGKRGGWQYITAGATGLAVTHVITSFMAVLFIAAFMAACFRLTLRRDILRQLGKAFAGTLLLNLYFLIPLLDTLLHTGLRENQTGPIYWYTAYPVQLFSTRYSHLSELVSKETPSDMLLEMPQSMGIAGLLIGMLVLYLLLTEKERGAARELAIAFVIYLAALWCASSLFPYAWLFRHGGWFAALLQRIEFAWRFLSFASVLLAAVSALAMRYCVLHRPGETRLRIVLTALVILSCAQGTNYLFQYCDQTEAEERVYDSDRGDAYTAMSTGEYLPLNPGNVRYTEPIFSDEQVISGENYYKKGLFASLQVNNRGMNEQYVEFPMFFYHGYRAFGANGPLNVVAGNGARVRVFVPGGYSGTVTVRFSPPWYWHLAELVSLLTALSALFLVRKRMVVFLRSFSGGRR